MNAKTLLLLPAAIVLGAPTATRAYVGFGFNFGIPLYFPAPVYSRPVVYQAPPRAMAELVTPAPGPGYVWLAGHWSFYGNNWAWVAGHWDLPPSPSALWVAGHWVQGSTGWIWVDGAWTAGTPPAPPQPPSAPASTEPSTPPPAPPTAYSVPAPSTPAPPAPEMVDGTVVTDDPPAPIAEYIPVAPDPAFAWIGGYWGWRGGWFWNAGHYARPPFRGAAWVSGGWAHGGRGWAWHGGRWR